MFLPYFLPHSSYHWILIIFTNIFSLKLEFRAISDVHDAWNKCSKRFLMHHFYSLLREIIFPVNKFPLSPQKRSGIRF